MGSAPSSLSFCGGYRPPTELFTMAPMEQRFHQNPSGRSARCIDCRLDLEERETHNPDDASTELALRLLARLLVRAAMPPNPIPVADPEKPLDVAAEPKVGLDPR